MIDIPAGQLKTDVSWRIEGGEDDQGTYFLSTGPVSSNVCSSVLSDPGKYILRSSLTVLTIGRHAGRMTVACARTKLLLPSGIANNVWIRIHPPFRN